MKILIAPDSFKESLSSIAVAQAIEKGWRQVFPNAECVKLPVADGGEGTVDALVFATQGHCFDAEVHDPLGQRITARYGTDATGCVAFIEMAAASGLMLVPPDKRNPLVTSSYGTGELIRDALDRGFTDILIGIGGSATNDGGAGMLQALGIRLLDSDGRDLPPGGAALSQLARIDVSGQHPRLAGCRMQIACDVNNPLTGPEGASAVFGPQKGATPEMVRELDAALARFATILRRDTGKDIASIPGAGAAGGMGAALLAFFRAELRPGIDIVLETIAMEQHLCHATLVITGEGRIDAQTICGKTPIGVARLAQKHGIPVIAIAGSIGAGAEAVFAHGITALHAIIPAPCTLQEALDHAADNIERTARNIAATFVIARSAADSPCHK